MVDEHGVTLREHLEQVERQTGERPDELNTPPTPRRMEYLFDIFAELSEARREDPIGYQAIESYTRLNGISLAWWEVEAVRRIDRAWFKVRSEKPHG